MARLFVVLPMFFLLLISKMSTEMSLGSYFICSAITFGAVSHAKSKFDEEVNLDDLFWAVLWPACWTMAAGISYYEDLDNRD
jgi:hypothetical protein